MQSTEVSQSHHIFIFPYSKYFHKCKAKQYLTVLAYIFLLCTQKLIIFCKTDPEFHFSFLTSQLLQLSVYHFVGYMHIMYSMSCNYQNQTGTRTNCLITISLNMQQKRTEVQLINVCRRQGNPCWKSVHYIGANILIFSIFVQVQKST